VLQTVRTANKVATRSLNIATFDNKLGGNAFFKAISHPLAQPKVQALLEKLNHKKVAVYDPHGFFLSFCEIHPVKFQITDYFVQDYQHFGKTVLNGLRAKPITEVKDPDHLLVADFAKINQVQHLLPGEISSFDELKIPEQYITNKWQYLHSLNFATNFALFREGNGLHTRLVSVNYWGLYNNGKSVTFYFCLFNEVGQIIQEWDETYDTPNQTLIVDSAEIKQRFNLDDFTGSLFMHAVGVAAHDIVKYALDVYGSDGKNLSCTHDANSWPADYYAGLPAPQSNEEVTLWLQNSHACPIPTDGIGLSYMGCDDIRILGKEIPPFGTYALNIRDLFPQARWPEQFEMHAGKYCVRPRYEVHGTTHRRIAHVNVERTDLRHDPEINKLRQHFGKGFILPAPILPTDRWSSIVLPTPMARGQMDLPIDLLVYDPHGIEVARHNFGKLRRSDSQAISIDDIAGDLNCGHMELVYAGDGHMDGWLHGLFRYQQRSGGHCAETSFGAHIFNTLITYKNEPQSYAGPAPGLSTKLFLRLDSQFEAFCHLIYPVSNKWHDFSTTQLILYDKAAQEISSHSIAIRAGGSLFWQASEMFSVDELQRGSYIIIRDTTCRLFGYHGLLDGERAFCLDHMFGF
jgi:hypothetical protein